MSNNEEMIGSIIGMALADAMMNQPKKSQSVSSRKTVIPEGAKAAKELYDSYVSVGFNEVQAFELLKLVLSK
jgi:hypothetical protein